MVINSIKANTNLLENPDKIKPQSPEKKDAELRKACAAFEGMFLEMMMKTMRKATMESSLIKKNNGEKIFAEMLDQQYVDAASKSSFTGLGETLYNHLKASSPEYAENVKGNNFPQTAINKYDMNKMRNDALGESRLDIMK